MVLSQRRDAKTQSLLFFRGCRDVRERTVCSAFSINKSLRLSGSAFFEKYDSLKFLVAGRVGLSQRIFSFHHRVSGVSRSFLLMSSRVKRSVAKDLECIAQPSQWMFPRSFLPVGRQGEIEKLCGTVYFVVNFQHYKDTKLKSESQVFRDIFFKKIQSKSRLSET